MLDQLFAPERPATGKTANGTFIIPLRGHASKTSYENSTIETRADLQFAANNAAIKQVLISADIRSSSFFGCNELFDSIKSLGKPCHLFIDDGLHGPVTAALLACTSVAINEPGMVGPFGSYLVVTDASEMARRLGIKVHKIATGEVKGLGVFGTELTPEQKTYLEQVVADEQKILDKIIATARPAATTEALAELSDKAIFAERALELKLVDYVENFDETLARIERS